MPGAGPTRPVGGVRDLDVRGACHAVAAEAEQVGIDPAAVARLAATLAAEGAPPAPSWPAPHLGTADAGAELVAGWVLLLTAMNFSFWQPEPRWRVAGHDGYLALATALRRAHDQGHAAGDTAHDAAMSVAELRHLLRGDPGGPESPPLLADRHATAISTAAWVRDGHAGSALAAVRSAGSAAGLSRLLATDLPRFRDIAEWRGRRVPLLKRAQVAAFDLGLALGGAAPELADRGGLTAFADYKLPQVLRAEGVLTLAPALAARLEARQELASGEEAEVELRALTVVAVDRLVDGLARWGVATDAASIDSRLWWRAQGRRDLPPYHRTRCIWY